MVYNRFHYNTALWNAGREEAPGIVRSIIQAHTGPHVQAVIGASGGTTLVSEFIITEGTVVKPPSQFKFPDLTAWIRAYQTQGPREDNLSVDLINALIRGFGFKDLPACVFIVERPPDLKARIFGLLEADLLATIVGKLGEHDLPAIIQVAVANLAATMLGVPAPNLRGTIFVQAPGNLGARIHTPLDLLATLFPVQFTDLPASIRGFQVAGLPGTMLGIPSPQILAFIRGVASDIKNLPARTLPITFIPGLPALIIPTFPGPNDFLATITGTGGFGAIGGIIKSVVSGEDTLGGFIKTADSEVNLPATVTGGGAFNLGGIIGMIPEGERDRFLNAFAQGLTSTALGASMTISTNVDFLGATILALRGTADLGARVRVAETFVTALLTVTTLASRDLRATIGRPDCAGGSANSVLNAAMVTQHAKSLGAFIESYAIKDLGATVNSANTFHAFDTIDVIFSPFQIPRAPSPFNATDTINIFFSPFRGKNLGAVVNVVQNNVLLNATITATFPLMKVVPAVNRLTAADLRLDRAQNIQEVRLQLEGELLEYIYVNGTDDAFIKDPNEDWKINIRSFRPVAAGIFGDRAANRICRLGSLTKFATMDEAIRFCIQSVLGFEDESNLGAFLQAKGQFKSLSATVGISDTFEDLGGIANRVFPSDVGATIGVNAVTNLNVGAVIAAITAGTGNLGATIAQLTDLDLGANITPEGNAKTLGAIIPGTIKIKALGATITVV